MQNAVVAALTASSILASGDTGLEALVRTSLARVVVARHREIQRGWEPDFYCLEFTDHPAEACDAGAQVEPVRAFDPPGPALGALPTRRPVLPGTRCRVEGGVVSGPLEGRGLRLSIGAVDWQARDAALVYVEEEWGPLAASGRAYLVVERDGVWAPDLGYVPPCLWLR